MTDRDTITNDDIVGNFEQLQLEAASASDPQLDDGETRVYFLGTNLGRYSVNDGKPTAYTVVEAGYDDGAEQLHVDPGYGAISGYRNAGLAPVEQNTIVQTHAHHDHFSNLPGTVELLYRAMIGEDDLQELAEAHDHDAAFTDLEVVSNPTSIEGTPEEIPAVTNYIQDQLGDERITVLEHGEEVTTRGGTGVAAVYNEHTEVLKTADPFELQAKANSYVLELPDGFSLVYLSEGPVHDGEQPDRIHPRIRSAVDGAVESAEHALVVGEVGPVYEPGTPFEDIPELWQNHFGTRGMELVADRYGDRDDVTVAFKEWGRETTRLEDGDLARTLREQGFEDLREWAVAAVEDETGVDGLELVTDGDVARYRDGDLRFTRV